MNRRDRLYYTAGAVYAWAGAITDAIVAAPVRAADAARNVWRLVGPGIALVRPLHCSTCNRTQHYVTRTTYRLLTKGRRVRCWWCGHLMIRLDPQEPPK